MSDVSANVIRLSIVIPVFNEERNIVPLLDELRAIFANLGSTEVIFIDDGSNDATAARLALDVSATAGGPTVRLIRHAQRVGQSVAVRTGVRAARGALVATLDGDGQNDPADLPRLLTAAETSGASLVSGVRVRRQDGVSKRLASRFANGLRQVLLRDGAVDTGCGIKVFRRDAFLDLPFFGAMHRFLPALFQIHGHQVIYLEVNHRPRLAGTTKYVNWRRAFVGIFDLLGVLWLKYRTPPVPVVTEARLG